MRTIILIFLVLFCSDVCSGQIQTIKTDQIYSPFSPDPIKTQVRISSDGRTVGYIINKKLVLLELETRLLDTIKNIQKWYWLDDYTFMVLHENKSLSIINTTDKQQLDLVFENIDDFELLKSNNETNEAICSILTKESSKTHIYNIDYDDNSYYLVDIIDQNQRLFFDKDFNITCSTKRTGLYNYEPFIKNRKTEWKRVDATNDSISQVGLSISNVLSVSSDGEITYLLNNYSTDKVVFKSHFKNRDTLLTLFKDDTYDLIWANPHISKRDGHPIALSGYSAAYQTHIIDSTYLNDYTYLNSKTLGNAQFVDADRDEKIWIVRYFTGPVSQYYIYNKNTKSLEFLFRDYDQLKQRSFAKRELLTTITSDGLTLGSQLIIPNGYNKTLPAIIYIHGGPWTGFFQQNPFYQLLFEYWTSRGYIIVNAQFRSGIGYGRQYVDAGKKEWGGKILSDIISVRESLVNTGLVDSTKLGIWGWSFGGYAVASALSFRPEKFTCGFTMYGLTDLLGFMKEKDFKNKGVLQWWKENLGEYRNPKDSLVLYESSPINYVKNIKSPILITHGEKDKKAPINQSLRFADSLMKYNKKVGCFFYPSEKHDFRATSSWHTTLAISENFFSKYLKGIDVNTCNKSDTINYKWIYKTY